MKSVGLAVPASPQAAGPLAVCFEVQGGRDMRGTPWLRASVVWQRAVRLWALQGRPRT